MAGTKRTIIGLAMLIAASCGDTQAPAEQPGVAVDGPSTTSSAPASTAPETTTTTQGSTTTDSPTTTTTSAPTTTADQRLVVRPGERFTVDTSDWNLPDGTSLYLVEQNVESPVWSAAGEVGSDTFTVPELIGWRKTGVEFALVDLVRWPAGEYALMEYQGRPLMTIEVPVDADVWGFDPEEFEEAAARVAPDPDLAILGVDGLADVAFGTPAVEALVALGDRFGDPVEDHRHDGCEGLLRQVRWANGIIATFDGTGEEAFRWYEFLADDRALDGDPTEPAGERPAFTTAQGLGLGMGLGDIWLNVQFLGFYDSNGWGSAIWQTDEIRLGGTLDDDLTNGGVVNGIGAGRDWNPMAAVC